MNGSATKVEDTTYDIKIGTESTPTKPAETGNNTPDNNNVQNRNVINNIANNANTNNTANKSNNIANNNTSNNTTNNTANNDTSNSILPKTGNGEESNRFGLIAAALIVGGVILYIKEKNIEIE